MDPEDVTGLLRRLQAGEQEAMDSLMPRVYSELRRLAARHLRLERHAHTLQPTALVHEAYVRLSGAGPIAWQDRAHFFAVAARLMRRILIDHARARHARKRDAPTQIVWAAEAEPQPLDVLLLDDALNRLARVDERQAAIVELRVFAGMTVEEAAEATGVSPRTVKADWKMARAWLSRELGARGRPA